MTVVIDIPEVALRKYDGAGIETTVIAVTGTRPILTPDATLETNGPVLTEKRCGRAKSLGPLLLRSTPLRPAKSLLPPLRRPHLLLARYRVDIPV